MATSPRSSTRTRILRGTAAAVLSAGAITLLGPATIASASGATVASTGTSAASAASAADFRTDFARGAEGWRVVLDGVMGGLSTGRLQGSGPGLLRFSGSLSLDNNGGFSQIRRAVDEGSFSGSDGVELLVKGDGRTYQFNIRVSNIRMMAGGFERTFETRNGEWTRVRIPYEDFVLTTFGRRVPNAPDLNPALIESVGITLADKNEGNFALEVAGIQAYRPGGERLPASPGGTVAAAPAADSNLPSLGEAATAAGLTAFLDVVGRADIAKDLPTGVPLTIFAPSNEAFAALPKRDVDALLSADGLPTLRRILSHHVSGDVAGPGDLFRRSWVESLAGQRLDVQAGDALRVGDATIVAGPVAFNGGTVFVVDQILMPELRTIADLAVETNQLSTLEAALRATDLLGLVGEENEGPWTVLAPVDSAFAALPAGTLDTLLREPGRQQLAGILGLHVIPGRLRAADLPSVTTVRTLPGRPLAIGFENGRPTIGGAGIVAADIEARNGIVHLIDRVITPAPEPSAASESSSSVASASGKTPADRFDEAITLIGRTIEIGVPLFNDGNEAACAAAYEVGLTSVLALGSERLDRTEQMTVTRALRDGSEEADPRERAWIYRRAMDALLGRLADRQDVTAITSSRR
ncbi:MAG: CIA30 family protein [Phycisphaerales bacterium]